MKKALLQQFCRFLAIGGTAAAVHLCTVILLVQTLAITPLQANIVGFLFGFQVSYWGHRAYTFNGTVVLHRVALPKLLSLQIFNFVVNEYLFYLFLSLQLPYPIALVIVLGIMAVFTFVVSKRFVF